MKYTSLRCLVVIASLMIGLSAFAQQLTWSLDEYDPNTTDVGGQNTRPGVASAVFNNQIWIAYLNQNTCNGNLCEIELANNNGAGLSFTNDHTISINGIIIAANANPSLAVISGTLYLTYTGAPNNNYIMSSTDGYNWVGPYLIASGFSTWYSPSMASNPYQPGFLYVGYMDGNTKEPIVCQLYVANGLGSLTQNCRDITNVGTISYNPGLAFYDGYLYMGISAGGSNCLEFIIGNADSFVYELKNPLNCAEYTNASPTLAVYNGDLYVGFRTNNNANLFTVRISTDGTNFPYRQQPGFGMGGPGDFLPVTISQGSNPAAPYLLNLYTYQHRLYYTYGK